VTYERSFISRSSLNDVTYSHVSIEAQDYFLIISRNIELESMRKSEIRAILKSPDNRAAPHTRGPRLRLSCVVYHVTAPPTGLN